jgi:hypothetical protein
MSVDVCSLEIEGEEGKRKEYYLDDWSMNEYECIRREKRRSEKQLVNHGRGLLLSPGQ